MKITQSFDSPLTRIQTINNTDNQQVNKNVNSLSTTNSAVDEVSISSQGKSHQ